MNANGSKNVNERHILTHSTKLNQKKNEKPQRNNETPPPHLLPPPLKQTPMHYAHDPYPTTNLTITWDGNFWVYSAAFHPDSPYSYSKGVHVF